MAAPGALLFTLALALVALWLSPSPHALDALADYLPLHSFLEGVSIVIAAMVFGVVWNSYSRERDGGIVLLACVFLAVALMDFVHTLSYPGMPDFITPSGADKSIFFWLAARLLSAGALLAVALLPSAPLRSPAVRYRLLAASLAFAALVFWVGLSGEATLPAMFVEGTGLTPAKVAIEGCLIALFASAAALFWRQARRGSSQSALLFAAAGVSVLSEASLSLYSSVTDVFSTLGHLYKAIAFGFLYRAVFVASVKEPFERLRERERALARAEKIAQLGSWQVEIPDNRIRYSEQALRIHGLSAAAFPGTLDAAIALAHPDDRLRLSSAINATLYDGAPFDIDYRIVRPDGGVRHVHAEDEVMRDAKGVPVRAFGITQDITDRVLAAEQLRASEERYRTVISAMAEGVVLQRADGAIVACNHGAERILGLTADQMSGRTSLDPRWRAIREDGSPFPGEAHPAMATLRTGIPQSDVTMGIHKPDGTLTWISINSQPMIRQGESVPHAVVTSFHDITERKLAAAKVARLTRVYAMLSGINAAIVRIRDRQELFEEACRIAVESGGFRMAWIGVLDRAEMVVKPVASAGEVGDFFASAPLAVVETRPGGHGLVGRALREKKAMLSNDVTSDPQRLMKRELEQRGINSLAVLPLVVADQAVGVLALYSTEAGFFDDQEMRLLLELAGDTAFALDHIEKEERISYLAYYDALTGLANRSLLLERLGQQIAAAGAADGKLALVIVNLERFKTVNDTLGRQAGDALLRQVAARLVEAAGDAGRVARVGADHFALLLPRVARDANLAERLRRGHAQVMGKPFFVEGRELRLSARAGVALFPDDGADAETLYHRAEAALKRVRRGEAFVFYTQAMTDQIAGRLTLESKLRQAVERQEFVLHYQPKVAIESRRIVGLEALIRWQSPERGLVPPMEFIPLLEETGLIVEVGGWAMARAAEDHARWLRLGMRAPRIAVNVSAVQLRSPDFVATVRRALGRGAAACGIDLEITETLLMEDIEQTIAKLVAVRKLGLDIAIDDFGIGYSSLSYLSRLPVQALKIDRSFVANLIDDSDRVSLVVTIISLAHALRLRVIAEGVETEVQANYLRLLRCDEMQGYLFGRPAPAAEIEPRLRETPAS